MWFVLEIIGLILFAILFNFIFYIPLIFRNWRLKRTLKKEQINLEKLKNGEIP